MKVVRVFSVVATVAIVGFGVISCKKDVTGVTLSQTTATLEVGKTLTLTATVLPDKAANKNVTWASSNPLVATVIGNGFVTAISPGKATIIVTTIDGSKTAECAVTVVFSSGITFPTGMLVIDLGDELSALNGVTAIDANGSDITSSLTVAGLDFVGNGNLTYTAKSSTGNDTKTRPVTIKPNKLFGNYSVIETGTYGTFSYNVTVTASSDLTKLVITNFFGEELTAVFEGDGKSTTLTMIPFEETFGEWIGKFTGTASYKKIAANYAIYECKFKVKWNDGEIEDYVATFEKK